jgi:hypothetical protein
MATLRKGTIAYLRQFTNSALEGVGERSILRGKDDLAWIFMAAILFAVVYRGAFRSSSMYERMLPRQYTIRHLLCLTTMAAIMAALVAWATKNGTG